MAEWPPLWSEGSGGERRRWSIGSRVFLALCIVGVAKLEANYVWSGIYLNSNFEVAFFKIQNFGVAYN
jgi:hypothetical protein